MARGYSEPTSFGLPRPGRALTGVLVALFAVWLAFAVSINWGGASEELFNLLSGNTALILRGELWRLFTAPFLHIHSGTIRHILYALIGLYFLAPALEREWGPKRFLLFLGGSAVFANVVQVLAELVLPASIGQRLFQQAYWFGSEGAFSAVSIAWALTFRGRQINLMLVIPVSSRALVVFVILINLMYVIGQVGVPEGYVAPFGGMLAGYLFGGSSPSPIRRLWLKARLFQLDAEARREADARKRRVSRSGFEVLEGGRGQSSDDEPKKPPGGWLN